MSFSEITYQGTVYTCPLSNHFRRHTDEEVADLRASIETDGVEVPIRIYCDTTLGLPNCVLDGEGRLSAAVAVSAPPNRVPIQYVGQLTTDEAYRRAKILNDKRRHDDPEAVRRRRAERIERVVEARSEGKSLRTIADDEDVSLGQIQRDLEDAVESGVSGDTPEAPATVTGRDGKSYPAERESGVSPDTSDDVPGDDAIDLDEYDLFDTSEGPEPAASESRAPENHSPVRKRGKAPVRVGPDHEYFDILTDITKLATKIAKAVNASEPESKLRVYLLAIGFVYPRAKIVRGRNYTWPCVGLRNAYRVIKWAGRSGKKMTKVEILKRIEEEDTKGQE
jgi:hypothetical protein